MRFDSIYEFLVFFVPFVVLTALLYVMCSSPHWALWIRTALFVLLEGLVTAVLYCAMYLFNKQLAAEMTEINKQIQTEIAQMRSPEQTR